MASQSGRESDPLVSFTYRLEIEGKLTASFFTECSGLGSEHEIIEHKAVDDQGREVVQKIPGRLKWSDVTLKRGITDSMDVWEWRETVENGEMGEARTNCSVVMMDRNYEDVARWDIENAWPSKVSGPELKADSNEFGVEEIVLIHEGLKRVS